MDGTSGWQASVARRQEHRAGDHVRDHPQSSVGLVEITEIFALDLQLPTDRTINIVTDDGRVVGKVLEIRRTKGEIYGAPLVEVKMEVDGEAAKRAIMAYSQVMRPVLHMFFDTPDPLTSTFNGYA